MTIKCPLCGEVCESDVEIQVGQCVQCPFCDGKFYYGDEQNADDAGSLLNEDIDSGAGESKAKVRFCAYCRAAIPEAAVFCGKCGRKVLVHDDNGVCTREADKREVKLCGQCGAKIPATASFCPGCGRAVLVEESNEIKATVETYPSAVEPAAEVNSANHGYFKNLLRLIVKWAVAIFIVICIANAVAKIRGCLSDSGRREAKYEETEKREEGISQEDAIKMAYILGALSGANNANNANSSGRSDAVRSWSPPVQPIRYDNNYERFANQGRMSESRNASAPVSKRSYRQSYPFEVWECCYCHRQVSSPSRPRNGEYTCLRSPKVGGFGSCYFERVDARR